MCGHLLTGLAIVDFKGRFFHINPHKTALIFIRPGWQAILTSMIAYCIVFVYLIIIAYNDVRGKISFAPNIIICDMEILFFF